MFQHTTAPPAPWFPLNLHHWRIPKPRSVDRLSDEDREEILELWNSGLSVAWINAEHGWSPTVVRLTLRELRKAGRYVRRGEAMSARLVLSEEQVAAICGSHKSLRELSRKYGVSRSVIQRARSGKYFDV